MQDQESAPVAASATTTVHVCVTCRVEGDLAEVRAGRRLHDALSAELAADPAVSIVPVECLSVCRRPCTVSFAAPGKWTYVYGDLPPEGSAPVVAEAAASTVRRPTG